MASRSKTPKQTVEVLGTVVFTLAVKDKDAAIEMMDELRSDGLFLHAKEFESYLLRNGVFLR